LQITKSEAQEIARKRGLPTAGWEPPRPRAKRRQLIELNDEEHQLILDNPDAAAFCAEQSIRGAMERGCSRELAEGLYRPKKH
jgi:hypothetical protein